MINWHSTIILKLEMEQKMNIIRKVDIYLKMANA